MVTALESKKALALVTAAGLATVSNIFRSSYGRPEDQRLELLESVPGAIEYYAYGAAALAADFYDDERERQSAPKLYIAEPIVADRIVKVRRAIAWASDPLFTGDTDSAYGRLADVVQLETARPYRDTILTNRRQDPAAVGWRRIARGGSCRFCKMLAGRGEVYKEATARFAAHGHCQCTAQPVFSSSEFGEEASVLQYVASSRKRTPRQREQLREYLDKHYPTESKKPPTASTAKAKSAGITAEDRTVRTKAQLASLNKTLPELKARAKAGEDVSKSIKWQQDRIAALQAELDNK